MMDFEKIYYNSKQQVLYGRYITNDKIVPILETLFLNSELKTIGKSVNEKPIYSIKIGSGKIKILIWSQMHGNESTTTKAIIDFLSFLKSESDESKVYLEKFSFLIIPILNPDGAVIYTRENANNIDLNRDFLNVSQPETKILLSVFKKFKPDYCYNMHDQRTIFGVKESRKPATVAFLAPSFNKNRDFNESRKKSADLIVAMNSDLQKFIPNQVSRFDDGFNNNCAGDYFQNLGVPTILFEAGHYADDYNREQTRKYIFIALLSGFNYLLKSQKFNFELEDYLNIPQNYPNFFDCIYKNVRINESEKEKIVNISIQYVEVLNKTNVEFIAKLAQIDQSDKYIGHFEFDADGKLYNNIKEKSIFNASADFKLDNLDIINGKLIKTN